MPPVQGVANAYRIRKGQYVGALVDTMVAVRLAGAFDVLYDDGSQDRLTISDELLTANTQANGLATDFPATKDGWLVSGSLIAVSGTIPPRGATYAQLYILNSNALVSGKDVETVIGSGNLYPRHAIAIGVFDEEGYATWVFQGTVAEDATAGTHVCTLTVTPGAGNELQVLYGSLVLGATATAQVVDVLIDDGTNMLTEYIRAASYTTSGQYLSFPLGTAQPANGVNQGVGTLSPSGIVSGTMRLILKVTTTAVSVTQTFAVTCRIRGAIPAATLADTVGTPTLTTNTNAVF